MDIARIFKLVGDRDTAFTYIIKKVAEEKTLAIRRDIVTDLCAYVDSENKKAVESIDEISKIKVFNLRCPECGSDIDEETGECDTCNSCK